MKRNRPNRERLPWRSVAFVLVAGTALCVTTLEATAQQPPAQQAPTTRQTPASTEQPSTAQAPGGAQAPASTQQSEAAPGRQREQGPETAHIIVGHSLLIRVPSRVKRILTGNPAVIETVLTTPQELVITAKTTGGSSLMLWDQAGLNRILDIYADLDVTPLRDTLDQSFPNSGVDVQSDADKVMLNGTVSSPAVADQMLKMAAAFAKDVVNGLQIAPPPHLRQVMLKVRFAEADRAKVTQFGVNLFSTNPKMLGALSTQQFGPLSEQTSGGNNGTSNSVFNLSNLLNIFLFRPDINLGATIQALAEKNVLQILAEPNLMAYSGQPAHFLAGGEFPYPIVQAVGTAGSTPAITIVFKPYGVKLEFLATIEDNDTIRLKVVPEVSALDYSNAVVISGFTLPALQVRRAETEIELKDGQSFGIAGLLDERTTLQLSKIPGIGDIPILGELFKSRNANRTLTELIVLVTPTIVDPVSGALPSPEPQVTMPVQNGVDPSKYDKGLPYQPKNPVNPATTGIPSTK